MQSLRFARAFALLTLCAFIAPLLAAPEASAIGILVPTDPSLSSLNLVYHRVDVQVTERGARTKVTQEFENTTGRQLEATYLFPLPKDATVDEFALWMNGKRETGQVMERQKARAIYESIVRRAQDPGLIEYVDAQLFQARVFPIPPNGRQKVELIYSHLVDYEGGTHRYVYPLKTDGRATSTLQDFTLNVKMQSKVDIKNVFSPSHRIAGRAQGKTAQASFEKGAFSLADDFVLYWQVADEDVGLTVLSTMDGEEAGYFLLLASPKDGVREKEIIGKRVSFVVDTSGSMAGEKMDRTKAALDYCIGQLGEDDLFNVITFGGYVETFEPKMVSAASGNKQRARAFVKNIEPLGGTNIDEALKAALTGASGSSKVPHLVVFLTDGRPTVGETDAAKILQGVKGLNKDGARVFVLGVGEDVNTILLDKLADENGGTQTYLRADASIETEVKAFYDKISHPVLADLALEVNGVRVFGEHPRKLTDLFKGGQIVVLGRYRDGGRATVKLTGKTPAGLRTFTYDTEFARGATEHAFIPRLWAQRQVGMLLAEIREKGERPGLVDEVTQLATRFGIVTPYTSYLVVEPGFAGGDESPPPRPALPSVMRGGSTGDGVGGGPGGPPASAPADDFGAFAPEADAEMERSDAPAKKGEGGRVAKAKDDSRSRQILREEAGEGAVAAAREIDRLRDSTVAGERKVATSMARALGRTFRYEAGFFVDERMGKKDQLLEVQAFGEAFFDVLRLRPDLKSALALSDRVKVQVAPGRTLVVSPEGAAKVDAAKLEKFLKR